MPISAISVLVILVAAVTASLVVGVRIMRSSGDRRPTSPTCGHCGYNLTGAPGNRCSECGLLFIEAGVVTPATSGKPRRRWLGIALCAGPLCLLVVMGLGMVMTLRARNAAMVAQQRALVAQQAALTQALATRQRTQTAGAGSGRPGIPTSRASDAADRAADRP